MKRFDSNIRIVVKAASKARHRQHRLGAALVRGGNIIAVGWNYDFIHAEHAALNRAWRSDVEGCTIVVVRVRKDGSLAMAKPCDLCMERLAKAGIRKVVYSNQNGELEIIRLQRYNTNESKAASNYSFLLPHGIRSERSTCST